MCRQELSNDSADPKNDPLLCAAQVFDYERWKMHRSSSRYLRHVAGLPDSRIAAGLVKPLAYVASVSLAVMAYNLLVEVTRAAAARAGGS